MLGGIQKRGATDLELETWETIDRQRRPASGSIELKGRGRRSLLPFHFDFTLPSCHFGRPKTERTN